MLPRKVQSLLDNVSHPHWHKSKDASKNQRSTATPQVPASASDGTSTSIGQHQQIRDQGVGKSTLARIISSTEQHQHQNQNQNQSNSGQSNKGMTTPKNASGDSSTLKLRTKKEFMYNLEEVKRLKPPHTKDEGCAQDIISEPRVSLDTIDQPNDKHRAKAVESDVLKTSASLGGNSSVEDRNDPKASPTSKENKSLKNATCEGLMGGQKKSGKPDIRSESTNQFTDRYKAKAKKAEADNLKKPFSQGRVSVGNDRNVQEIETKLNKNSNLKKVVGGTAESGQKTSAIPGVSEETINQFSDRYKAKAMEADTFKTSNERGESIQKTNFKTGVSTDTPDLFNDRYRAKLKRNVALNSPSLAGKVSSAGGAHELKVDSGSKESKTSEQKTNGEPGVSAETITQFNDRYKAKALKAATLKASPLVGSDSSANEQKIESKLSENNNGKKILHKAAVAGEKISTKPGISAETRSQFNDRYKAKAMKVDDSKKTPSLGTVSSEDGDHHHGMSSIINEDNGLKKAACEGTESAQHMSLKPGVSAETLNQFSDRFKSKAMKSDDLNAPLSMGKFSNARSQVEHTMRAEASESNKLKQAKGRTTSMQKRGTKPGVSAETIDQFNDRYKAKALKKNGSKAPSSARSTSADEEQNQKANLKSNKVNSPNQENETAISRHEKSSKPGTSSETISQFNARYKAKAMKEGNLKESTSASEISGASEKDSLRNDSTSNSTNELNHPKDVSMRENKLTTKPGVSSETINQFTDRYKNKARDTNNLKDTRLAGSTDNIHSSKDSVKINGRTKSLNEATKEATTERQSSGAINYFNDRVRAKAGEADSSKSTILTGGVSRDDEEHNLKRSSEVNNVNHPRKEACDKGLLQGRSFIETSDEEHLRTIVEDFVKQGQCQDIIDCLERLRHTSPAFVIFVLHKLREALTSTYEALDELQVESSSELLDISALFIAMSNHLSNETVQFEALHTIWIVMCLHPQLCSELLSKEDSVLAIMRSMEKHSESVSVSWYGSGVIAFIAASPNFSCSQLPIYSIIQRLFDALKVPCQIGSVQENSLRALTRLKLSSDTMIKFSENVLSSTPENSCKNNGMEVILAVMGRYPENVFVQTNGNRLMWDLFCSDFQKYGIGIFTHVQKVFQSHTNSVSFLESAICLLSKIFTFGDWSHISLEDVALLVISIMTAPPTISSVIAQHGCRCLHILCPRDSIATDSIRSVLDCMREFPDNLAVQEEACSTLEAMCKNSPPNVNTVVTLGGIELVYRAYNFSSAPNDEEGNLTTKTRVCSALAVLVSDPSALKKFHDMGIFEDLKKKVARDPYLQGIFDLAPENEETSQSIDPCALATHVQTCQWLLSNLKSASEQIEIFDVFSAMDSFPASAKVQEFACKVLANAHSLAMINHTDYVQVLHRVLRCMREHHDDPNVMEAACSVVNNLREIGCYESEILSDLFDQVMVVVSSHRKQPQVLEQAFGGLWALCLDSGSATSFINSSAVEDIISIELSSLSPESRKNCIGLLWAFSTRDRKRFISEDSVDFIVQVLEFENECDAIITAMNLIALIAKQSLQGISILLDNEDLIDSVIRCMQLYPAIGELQGAGCEILSSVASDSNVMTYISNNGGTACVALALKHCSSDPFLVVKSFAALSNLFSGTDIDILQETSALNFIVDAMQIHRNELFVQIQGASTIWCLVARHDWFKREVTRLGGSHLIAQAMNTFLASPEMQERGTIALWSLAVASNSVEIEVADEAIEPIVNGVAAHVSHQSICEKGLGALSTLARNNSKLTGMKSMIRELIFSCMWMHTENAQLQTAAMAALSILSVDVETNQVSQISSDDLHAIIHAMEIHQQVKDVQESAIILLQNFLISPANRDVILQHDSFLVGLIHSAMENFNYTLQGRPEDLLANLS